MLLKLLAMSRSGALRRDPLVRAKTGAQHRSEKEIRIMTRKTPQLGLRLVAIAVLAAFTTPTAQAFDFSYSQTGIGKTMPQACNDAIQKIAANCDQYGAITTDPLFCKPLYTAEGEYIFDVCSCKATATFCRNFINPLQ